MRITLFIAGIATFALAASALAQPPAGSGNQLPAMTPEPQAALAAKREAELKAPRPIDALDSVWMEKLTWMEVRDAIAGGKTAALILTGGVESNGPYLATGKHNVILAVMGEAIARKLGNALVAPILTLEPGRPDGPRVAPGSVLLSQETYRAVLTDMALSLKSMGFKDVILMGDSGGNQAGMKEVAAALNARHNGDPARFHFIPEYYDYDSVQKLVKSSGIAEQIEPGASAGSDSIHDEYGIDALMAVADPSTIRIEQRKTANKTTINGVSLLPIEKTIEMGKKIVEFRTQLTVTAINKALGAKTSQQ